MLSLVTYVTSWTRLAGTFPRRVFLWFGYIWTDKAFICSNYAGNWFFLSTPNYLYFLKAILIHYLIFSRSVNMAKIRVKLLIHLNNNSNMISHLKFSAIEIVFYLESTLKSMLLSDIRGHVIFTVQQRFQIGPMKTSNRHSHNAVFYSRGPWHSTKRYKLLIYF